MLVWPLLIATSLADAPRIVGGQVAAAEDWPSVVALRNGDALTCTGTLIASDIVLTAAHCSAANNVLLDTADLSAPGVVVPIAAFTVYPGWATTYDVAWVRLESPVATPPALLTLDCLPEEWLFDGASAQIAGFGTLDAWSSERTDVLHMAQITVVDADCDESDHGCMDEVAPGGELTAGGGGVDTCVGDSGGGLWVGPTDKPYLAAVTSRGRRPASTPCGDGGIYVRVDAIADWIETETGIVLERPTCEGFSPNHAPNPTATPIILPALGTGAITIDPGDEDPDDKHTFTLATIEPGLFIEVSGSGDVSVQDTLGTVRSGAFEVTVQDDGDPSRSADVSVYYTVAPDPGTRGCTSSPRPSGWWPIGMLLWACRCRLRAARPEGTARTSAGSHASSLRW